MTTDKINKCREAGKKLNGQQPIETVILDIVDCLMEVRFGMKETDMEFDLNVDVVGLELAEAFIRLCGMTKNDYSNRIPDGGYNTNDIWMENITSYLCKHQYDSSLVEIKYFCKHNNINLEKYCDQLAQSLTKK